MSEMAQNGARHQQIQGAYELWQQATAGLEIAKKSYERVQRLYDEGVMSAQKRDEALAAYKVTEDQVVSAKAQYELAKSGAREQEKRAAAKQVQVAKGAVNVVKSILKETVQVAGAEGEVSAIYPKQGELVGLGSPIMSISQTKDMWGAFNVREDQLKGMKVGDKFKAYVPAFDKEIEMQVFSMKDEGSYAVWKATKTTGQYDLKTFEVKARPLKPFDGLRPGMSLIVK
jgi:HlyD family secretion protein